jgi:hypothetical protein
VDTLAGASSVLAWISGSPISGIVRSPSCTGPLRRCGWRIHRSVSHRVAVESPRTPKLRTRAWALRGSPLQNPPALPGDPWSSRTGEWRSSTGSGGAAIAGDDCTRRTIHGRCGGSATVPPHTSSVATASVAPVAGSEKRRRL